MKTMIFGFSMLFAMLSSSMDVYAQTQGKGKKTGHTKERYIDRRGAPMNATRAVVVAPPPPPSRAVLKNPNIPPPPPPAPATPSPRAVEKRKK